MRYTSVVSAVFVCCAFPAFGAPNPFDPAVNPVIQNQPFQTATLEETNLIEDLLGRVFEETSQTVRELQDLGDAENDEDFRCRLRNLIGGETKCLLVG